MTPLLTVCGDFFGGAIEVTDWRLLIAYHVPKHIIIGQDQHRAAVECGALQI